MLKNFSLRRKFTILLTIILVAGLTLSGLVLSSVLRQNARNDVAATGLILMEAMGSVREYTSTQINPELADRLEEVFLPQTIPAYSAREVFDLLRGHPEYRDFFYKEATLNPTNLRDKADGFETQIVERFRDNTSLREVSGFRSVPSGKVFYIARPLIVPSETCLTCHSTPDRAPRSQIERYGAANGFGWQLNEIVGARMVSVPASRVINKANQSILLILGIVSGIFVAVILLVNAILNRQVIRPLKRMTRVAEEVSTGHTDLEFEQLSNDEIGNLARAFKRMQLSLEIALKRLNRNTHGG
ncbi:c-type heme family protein [Egbenema bharatensis]|uniref:c-type heme family protein n=1 Tax=Egbenema bharatensis TaxID=3463334 RepID=UPI003A83D8EB